VEWEKCEHQMVTSLYIEHCLLLNGKDLGVRAFNKCELCGYESHSQYLYKDELEDKYSQELFQVWKRLWLGASTYDKPPFCYNSPPVKMAQGTDFETFKEKLFDRIITREVKSPISSGSVLVSGTIVPTWDNETQKETQAI